MNEDGELVEAARRACAQPGRLRMHFQPIVDLARGQVCGYESLARFIGPPDATPDRWFAAAHVAGVGVQLEARALAAALAARSALPPNCFMTVNLGPEALASTPVQDVLRQAGSLGGVVLELTEHDAVADYAELRAMLAPWRRAGAMVAVDDLGAGFSSLTHVVSLRPDLIKVDRGLIARLDADETKAVVVETLGVVAGRLDAWLLAEGVETHGELERLLSLGVPLGQGYGLGRPAPTMTDADPAALALCRRRARVGVIGELFALAETAPRVSPGASEWTVAEAFRPNPSALWAVEVDERDRPLRLLRRPTALGGAQPAAPLLVLPSEALTDVVRRVVTRPLACRWLPVVVCDELSRLIGLVPIERVLERLADSVDGVPVVGSDAGWSHPDPTLRPTAG